MDAHQLFRLSLLREAAQHCYFKTDLVLLPKVLSICVAVACNSPRPAMIITDRKTLELGEANLRARHPVRLSSTIKAEESA